MNLTIPNLLSILRMGLVPLFIIAVIEGRAWQALVIFVVAGVTDLADGLIARFWHQQSQLGAYLDPAADKLLLVSAYVSLALATVAGAPRIPIWITVLVVARDILIVIVSLIFYVALGVTRFPPSLLSKVNTVAQVVAIGLVLLAGVVPVLDGVALASLYLVAALTLASGISYVVRANQLVAGSGKPPAPEGR